MSGNLLSISIKQLVLLWEAGSANVRVLLGSHWTLELQQRYVILQGIRIKSGMNKDLCNGHFNVIQTWMVFYTCHIQIAKAYLQGPAPEIGATG